MDDGPGVLLIDAAKCHGWILDPETVYLLQGTIQGEAVDVYNGDKPRPVGGKMVEAYKDA